MLKYPSTVTAIAICAIFSCPPLAQAQAKSLQMEYQNVVRCLAIQGAVQRVMLTDGSDENQLDEQKIRVALLAGMSRDLAEKMNLPEEKLVSDLIDEGNAMMNDKAHMMQTVQICADTEMTLSMKKFSISSSDYTAQFE